MRVTIFDYGAGNLHSLAKALSAADTQVSLEQDPLRCIDTDLLVLPGVGSFTQASGRLAPARERLRDAVRGGLPTLGICLGMQLLFSRSEEGDGEGLGVLDGCVTRLAARRVPQMGWNAIEEARDLLLHRSRLTEAYYANGFVCRPTDDVSVVAWSRHEGDRFAAMVRAHRTIGVQFHPEKSSAAGVEFLRGVIAEART
jgi:imidazole glycerol-phosphate synthase subunit HisH